MSCGISWSGFESARRRREARAKPEKILPPSGLVGLDAGASAFVEIAYQLEGWQTCLSLRSAHARRWVALQKIITGWQRHVAQHRGDAQAMGRLIVDEVAKTYKGLDVRMTAVNLGALEDTGRVLDTLSLSLMQSLGDWHVLTAIQRAVSSTNWISLELPEDDAKAGKASGTADSPELLPAVDLLELLGLLHQELKAECKEAPSEHGQRKRIEQLSCLTQSALAALQTEPGSANGLILHARPTTGRGLSILMPRPSGARVRFV